MMDFKGLKFRLSPFFLLFVFLFTFACSIPSWFPIKGGASSKAAKKTKDLGDREIIIIDQVEYVKLYNPDASDGKPRYLYIPVKEYLAKKETYASFSYRKEEPKKQPSPNSPSSIFPSSPGVGDQVPVTASQSPSLSLKRKVVIAYFDDRALQTEETFGDWIAEKLIREVDRRSQKVLFVDYRMVKEFLESRGIPLRDMETPDVLRLLNEVFGIHALISGHLSGPYTFVAKGEKDLEGTASAIIKIEMKLIDTLTGKTLKQLEASNPILATKMRGSFSEEKAKVKAIDMTLTNLTGPLGRELDNLDWFSRIAKIEGEEVYLNAGRLTGIKEGDVMEVFRPGKPGERGEVKGKIRILNCFGIDASMGNLIQGKKPEADDILRFASHEGPKS
jgi:hypothetical protein